jgi:hypothetical protein
MFGIYLSKQNSIYLPNEGIVPVDLLGEAYGSEIGAKGIAGFVNLTALRLPEGFRRLVGLDIVIGAMPNLEEPHLSSEFIFNRSKSNDGKPIDSLVLVPAGMNFQAGWVYDRSDSSERPYGDLVETFRNLAGK